MLIQPSAERLSAFIEITERTIVSGRNINGERFKITRRSDGRFGYSVWQPPAPGRREWIEAGSALTEGDAKTAIERAIKEMTA